LTHFGASDTIIIMRILASSDLHYNIKRSKEPAEELARKTVLRGGDVLILAGDIAGIGPEHFLGCLELFSKFKGEKFLVAGNHDLWVRPGQCSFEKWSKHLPRLAKEAGFWMLDHQPKIVDHIGFVGNIGWYDYSFRDEGLKIPMRFYEAKVGPGRALRLSEYQHLLDPTDQLLPEHRDITTSWRDGQYVNLPMSDKEFVEHLIEKLQTDLIGVSRNCEKMVAVFHHLPCRKLIWYRQNSNWDFAAAFLGSQRFREVLDNHPTLCLCLSGHNHRANVIKGEVLDYITIGSTYDEKVLLEFEL